MKMVIQGRGMAFCLSTEQDLFSFKLYQLYCKLFPVKAIAV